MTIIAVLFAGMAVLASFSADAFASVDGSTSFGEDKFGTSKAHPTKDGGREWLIDMDDPKDGIFDPRAEITRQEDGSWRISGQDNGKDQVRMNVYTPEGAEEWKDVEITGYARIVETLGHESHADSDLDNVLQWYARSGEHHSKSEPYEGTSIKGRLHLDGTVGWKKELWHTGGYTEEDGLSKATSKPLVEQHDERGRYYDGSWFGFKVVIYNTDSDAAVKMEAYVDEHADNRWRKVSEFVDDGGWNAVSAKEFEKAGCDKARDHVLTESGPVVAFRSDKIVWDFKDLSVREIEPVVQEPHVWPAFSAYPAYSVYPS